VDSTIARYGGKPVARADGFEVLEGGWHAGRKGDDSQPERVTAIEFPDMGRLKAWYTLKEYALLKSVRQEAAAAQPTGARAEETDGLAEPCAIPALRSSRRAWRAAGARR
jgi:uncharacterized protein (DUF1330 family)